MDCCRDKCECKVNTYCLNWRSGSKEIVKGFDIKHAISRAGYGGGALRALDFWEQVEDNLGEEGK